MAEAAGLKAHVFTSPHLVRFNERIRLAGDLIEDDYLIDILERTYRALGDGEITHFEATTAAALLGFSETQADLLILEVGLGGRYDATNVIDTPAVSVITPVDYDHKQFLGTDLALIAGEKAGIIKSGRPVVSAPQARICDEIIQAECERLNAPFQRLTIADLERVPETVSLPGTHQRYNAALAGIALRTLPHPGIRCHAIWTGATNAIWPARMQQLKPGPIVEMAGGAEVWLDGGHNPHAASAISELVQQLGGRTILVAAMMASKDHGNFFAAMTSIAEAVHTVPNAEGHAGADPQTLADTARRYIPSVFAHSTFSDAMRAASLTAPDRILICGSLYLAGEVLAANHQVPD